ncbi:MAG: hypothetical protein GXO11_02110 [Epsilonproteobacteria bacterium]|nr:hypothetical protein [Campylobacterota bacterium]
MLSNITKDHNFALLMKQHILDVLGFLFDKEQNFGILCKIEDVSFNPELPDYMQDGFAPLTLFFLAGYTYESAYIDGENVVFEAGFGSENFGSVVTVPLLSIMQIIVDETPIFINLSEVKEPVDTEVESNENEIDEQSLENSMNVFLSNPENEKFFKK